MNFNDLIGTDRHFEKISMSVWSEDKAIALGLLSMLVNMFYGLLMKQLGVVHKIHTLVHS